MKRYNLSLKDETYARMEELALRSGMPLSVLFRRFIALGLAVAEAQAEGGRAIIKTGSAVSEVGRLAGEEVVR